MVYETSLFAIHSRARSDLAHEEIVKVGGCASVKGRKSFAMDRKKHSRNFAYRKPISLVSFGPIACEEDGRYDDLYYNLARALVYIYNDIPGVNPATEFAVCGAKVARDATTGDERLLAIANGHKVSMTYGQLLGLWKKWHTKPFDYMEAKKVLAKLKKAIEAESAQE